MFRVQRLLNAQILSYLLTDRHGRAISQVRTIFNFFLSVFYQKPFSFSFFFLDKVLIFCHGFVFIFWKQVNLSLEQPKKQKLKMRLDVHGIDVILMEIFLQIGVMMVAI